MNSFITKPVTFAGLVEVMQALSRYWFEIVELPRCARARRQWTSLSRSGSSSSRTTRTTSSSPATCSTSRTAPASRSMGARPTDEALRRSRERRHDVYLIDYRLGASTGLDLRPRGVRGRSPRAGDHAHRPRRLRGRPRGDELGVTDFLVKGRLDAALLERSIRYAIRHHAGARPSCARARSATRSPCEGPTTGSGTGTSWRTAIYSARAGRQMLGHSDEEHRRLARGVVRARAPRRSRAAAGRDRRPPGGAHAPLRERAPDPARATAATAGCSAAASPSATARAGRRGWPARCPTSPTASSPRSGCATTRCHDSLTGLPNRALFLDRPGAARSAGAERHPRLSLRRPVPRPRPLQARQRRLRPRGRRSAAGGGRPPARAGLRPGDTVARLGGDEFTILLDDIESRERPRSGRRADPRRPCASRSRSRGRSLSVTASIGIAVERARQQGDGADAQRGHRDVRREGERRRHVAVFTASMRSRVVGQLQLETELREAIERERLRVFYQPIVELEHGRIAGFEALARWPADAEREVPPDRVHPGRRGHRADPAARVAWCSRGVRAAERMARATAWSATT